MLHWSQIEIHYCVLGFFMDIGFSRKCRPSASREGIGEYNTVPNHNTVQLFCDVYCRQPITCFFDLVHYMHKLS